MSRQVKTAQGVVWYPLGDGKWVAVAPNRAVPEKCLLINEQGQRLLARLSEDAGVSMEDASASDQERMEQWLDPKYRLLEEVQEQPLQPAHGDIALSIFREYQSARAFEGDRDLVDYHKTEIKDPFRQFEEVEMTVSHLYRKPHVALQGKSYGARFALTLIEGGALRQGMRILEVGCGTGIFGREFLSAVREDRPGIYDTLGYTFFDLSPVLARSQKEINREHEKIVSFQSGDAYAHPFEEGAFDLIIANEMIADLPVVKMNRENPSEGGAEKEGWEWCKELGLDYADAPPEFVLNLGAIKFMEKLSRTLAPGGRAFVVEYGSPWSYPAAQVVTNHTEYSIHFGHLLTASERFGLEGTLTGLHAFLGFQGETQVLADLTHLSLFGHLLPFLGVEGEPARVYTRDMLEQALPAICKNIGNVVFVPLHSLGSIVYPIGFYALTLHKPV
jgi:SAM-dependent methyltransferase